MRLNFSKNPQDGITILFSILIMSTIAVISFAVASFVVIEVRGSRASTLTEPAIVAAETAGEQSIFLIKRGTFTTDCSSASYTQTSGTTGGSTNTRIKKCLTSVPATFQFTNADPLVVYIYDPNDVNGNTCMEQSTPCNSSGVGTGSQLFSSVIVRYLTGDFNIDVDMVTLDGIVVTNSTLTPTSTGTYPIALDIPSASDERLRLTLTPTSGSSTVEISTTGVYNGLPDYQTVDLEGCVSLVNITNCESSNETHKRRLNITLPR